jgi:hypothetical protein
VQQHNNKARRQNIGQGAKAKKRQENIFKKNLTKIKNSQHKCK